MKIRIALLTAIGAVAALTTTANADVIDRREAIQERRIQQGVRDGSLTRSEYRQLEAEQARIRELERRARADGIVTRREAAQIDAAQDAASRHIYQERHDAETRRSGWGFGRGR